MSNRDDLRTVFTGPSMTPAWWAAYERLRSPQGSVEDITQAIAGKRTTHDERQNLTAALVHDYDDEQLIEWIHALQDREEELEAQVERLQLAYEDMKREYDEKSDRVDQLNHAAEWWAWWMANATPEEKAEYEHR